MRSQFKNNPLVEGLTAKPRLLVVSHESAVLRPLWALADVNGWRVEEGASAWDAMEQVRSGHAPDMLVLDVARGDHDSLHILRWLRRLSPDLPAVVICSSAEAEQRKEAIRLGAQEVLLRPFDTVELESAIARHLDAHQPNWADLDSQDIEPLGPDAFFVSASPATQKLRAQVELLAEADVPVFILGEAGSGKDTVARLIHKWSVRSGCKFLKVSCADMPADLLESELFGSEATPQRGARIGKFERAEKGTIFLDEITEMPLALQTRLMQVLQDKLLVKPGTAHAVPADVRMLASSSADIEKAIAQRKLREDLYYRLSAFTVQVPPLRQRKGEITVLLQHLMHKLARQYGLPAREISPRVLDACQHYSWPGNLRELETFAKRYLVSGNEEISSGEFEWEEDRSSGDREGPSLARHKLVESESKSLKSLIQSVKSETERTAIGTALQKTGWNRKAAARLLQVSYRTLLYKIDQYHMNATEPDLPALEGQRYPLQSVAAKVPGKEQR